jgi:isopenicillin N synthase-like dioxygenase
VRARLALGDGLPSFRTIETTAGGRPLGRVPTALGGSLAGAYPPGVVSKYTVPLVDIGPFLVQDSGAWATVAAEVRKACEETGFLTVVGHGVPAELVGRMGGVQARGGEWIEVEPPSEGFVVNIGELMVRWTNDAWAATLHRVVNPPREGRIGSRRQSLVFFHNPRSDAVIETIDRLAAPREPGRYEPITAGEYVLAKAEQAFAVSRKAAS